MLHNALAEYLERVERAVLQCVEARAERYVEEVITSEQATLRIRLRFGTGHLLEIGEAIVIEDDSMIFLDYHYHYQDKDNRMIFRYDGTPHHRHIPTFPHHKHLPDSIVESDKPDIEQVIEEAVRELRKDISN